MNRCWLLTLALIVINSASAEAQTLESELLQVPAQELAMQARSQGDAARGAVVFFQHQMACSKCHSVGGTIASSLGPDLTTIEKGVTDESLVESVLVPSKVIRRGFESVTVITKQGQSLSGILAERTPERVVIRNSARNGELVTVALSDIDEAVQQVLSLMPAGQVNQLASRQQFFDLIRYLMEIRDGGAARAKELQPSPALLTFTLPEYEADIDHAGLIQDWNDESLKRGEAIYRRVCMNCHGTRDQPGSLPTSLRFADGRFRNGSDPWAMYQTLTRGFGLMAAQTWMVPSQKYDVIHYLRETWLRPHNPTQYVAVDSAYLSRLPVGKSRGPEPGRIQPWNAMDYGPSLTHTYEVPGPAHNFAYKGIAVRLDPGAGGVSRGRHWMLFDTDTLRLAAAWNAPVPASAEENFIDWRGIQFNGEHQIHPRVTGHVQISSATGPGWANPTTGAFSDNLRVEGRDGRRYGPLPREWARFRGLYHHGQQVVLSYAIGGTEVLESPSMMSSDQASQPAILMRTFHIGPRAANLVLQVADHVEAESAVAVFRKNRSSAADAVDTRLQLRNTEKDSLFVGILPSNLPLTWTADTGHLRLSIPAGSEPLQFTIWTAESEYDLSSPQAPRPPLGAVQQDLKSLTLGGPPRWAQKLTTTALIGSDKAAFAADVLTAPEGNPWLAQMRFTGLDFFADGRIAACTWDGDVWIVEQQAARAQLVWQRIASGLFQPLGLRILNDRIHVTCRDQLAVLNDLNGDGETDFYECLNNDHQVTEHFHEFAMGLQTDAEGHFYYAKSARHAKPAVVPHHGTLLRVSPDGSRTDILANGFRAANGVCLNPDGSFVVTDQEGHWNPKNRINWVTLDPSGRPKFYGNMFGYHDVTDSADSAMQPPLCWITNAFDRSPGELLWVRSQRWGPLNGALLNLSYGTGKVFLVPHESVGGQMQGGMIELPLPAFPTGVMRGRFHPQDEHLYLCGMFAWAGSATQPGGLYRLRPGNEPMNLPLGLNATRSGLVLTFTEPLDPASVNPAGVQLQTWSLKRSARYGSDHHDETSLPVTGTTLSEDGRTLTIACDLSPTWCMAIRYTLKSAAGHNVTGTIHNTIHQVAE